MVSGTREHHYAGVVKISGEPFWLLPATGPDFHIELGLLMKSTFRIALVAAIAVGYGSSRANGEYRTWKAAQGNYSTEAEFVAVKGDTVSIKLKDGTPREIPLSKLSEADQAYVRSKLGMAEPKLSQRPAAPQQTEEEAEKALKSVDKEAQRCRTADEAVVLYTVFLSDTTVPSATRATAQQHLAEWKSMAEKGLVRSGTKWVTAEEVRNGRIKAAFLINQGLEMVRLGQDKLGYDKLMEASSTAPDDIYADFIIGTVFAIAMQKFDKAEHHYEACLRRDPDNPSVLNNLALAEIKSGHHRDALNHWKTAAALCQDQRIAQNIGRLFDQAGRGRILVSKSILSQLADVYASLVIAKNVSVAQAQLGWQYMLVPQPPPADETAAAVPGASEELDPTIAVCGSGFVVSPRFVLTTRMSTKGATDFLIADPMNKGKTLPAKLVASSKDTDLALLECADLKSPALPADPMLPRPDTDVLVAGYPLVDASGLAIKMARGNTMAAASVGKVGVLTYEAAGSPSVGGGPVTDSMGNVVAMHWKTLGSLNNRYGAGVPMSAALPFITASIPTDFHPALPNKADMPWNEIEEQTKMSTVVVLSKTPSQDVGLSKRVGPGFLVDASCCRCNGFKSIRCLARSCTNGKIANIRQEKTGSNPITGAAMYEDVKFYTPCPVCGGRGLIPCVVCHGTGVDPDVRVPTRGSLAQPATNGPALAQSTTAEPDQSAPKSSSRSSTRSRRGDHPSLDPAIGNRIHDAIVSNRTTDTPRSGGSGTEFRDVPSEGALLVGVIIDWQDPSKTKAVGITPVYQTAKGQVRGRTFGRSTGIQGGSMARPGYALGGLEIPSDSIVEGMQVWMLRDTGSGLNPSDNHRIHVRGGNPSSTSMLRLGLDGSYVIGITGSTSSSGELSGLGLVLTR
jgi:S1-C subfamily serine protease